jgi:2-polyprenyl-3-methyl-5-hydroxy-6-metoxy-1,4-benzoquinol methylase
MYNKTQLNPDIAFEKHVFHRDMFAHYIRWSFVLNKAALGMNILDYGCGSANLVEVLYRNKFKCLEYLGIDIRKLTINNNKEKFKNVSWMNFNTFDLVNYTEKITSKNGENWDYICCFEVLEHIGKNNQIKFLQNIKNNMSNNTILLISTPCYDLHIGAANNHIINGEVSELTYKEMEDLLISQGFIIEDNFGTFASQKDYKPYMNEHEQYMFNKLSKYYDSNLISIIFAPLFPEHSRNCIWICKLQEVK